MSEHPPLPELRDGFRFRGGHRALDLTATLAGRLKAASRDLLAVPEDLCRWLRAAGFEAEAIVASEADLATARRLREAVHALADARIGGAADPADARVALNAIAAGPAAAPQLDSHGALAWHGDSATLTALVAREAVVLFGGPQASNIRRCEADGCAILFLDTSRSGDRRWCSMAACGNKAKVAEFRRRRRAAEQ